MSKSQHGSADLAVNASKSSCESALGFFADIPNPPWSGKVPKRWELAPGLGALWCPTDGAAELKKRVMKWPDEEQLPSQPDYTSAGELDGLTDGWRTCSACWSSWMSVVPVTSLSWLSSVCWCCREREKERGVNNVCTKIAPVEEHVLIRSV